MFMKKIQWFFIAAALITLITGCGDSTTSGGVTPDPIPAAPSGKVAQNYISGATVWADRIEKDGIGDFQILGEELFTQANSGNQGDFILPATPSYDYVLASKGGNDVLLGITAFPMLAPKGAANITPITTLVVFEPSLKSILGGPGVYDTDIAFTEGTNPYVLKISKIIELLAQNTKGSSQQLALMRSMAAQMKTAINLTDAARKDFLLGIMDTLAPEDAKASLKAKAEQYIDAIESRIFDGKVQEEAVVRAVGPFMARFASIHFDNMTRTPGNLLVITENTATSVQTLGVTVAFNAGLTQHTWTDAPIVVEAYQAGNKKYFQTIISGLNLTTNTGSGEKISIAAPQSFKIYQHTRMGEGTSYSETEHTAIFSAHSLPIFINVSNNQEIILSANGILPSNFFTPGEYTLRFSVRNAPGLLASEKIRLLVQ